MGFKRDVLLKPAQLTGLFVSRSASIAGDQYKLDTFFQPQATFQLGHWPINVLVTISQTKEEKTKKKKKKKNYSTGHKREQHEGAMRVQ